MTTSKRELHVFFETPMSLRHIQTSAPRKQNASPLSEPCITSLSTQTNILDWTVSTKHRAQTQGSTGGPRGPAAGSSPPHTASQAEELMVSLQWAVRGPQTLCFISLLASLM